MSSLASEAFEEGGSHHVVATGSEVIVDEETPGIGSFGVENAGTVVGSLKANGIKNGGEGVSNQGLVACCTKP